MIVLVDHGVASMCSEPVDGEASKMASTLTAVDNS